ncbi:MAG: TspO/MBR family protein [Candidatus Pacearchaeota archaeon]|jgi:tryptophan-rich sensory protein
MECKKHWRILLVCLIIVYAVAFIGGLFTTNAVKSDWYQTIKPSITPPNWVFPVVWNVLFLLIAISMCFSWASKKQNQKTSIIVSYWINLMLNILWSVFYFGFKSPLHALVIAVLMLVSIIHLIILNWKINKKASYLLIPYLLWIGFAIILNYLSI